MPTFFRTHWTHHWRFYFCLLLGAFVFTLTGRLQSPERILVSGDVLFASYIALMAFVAVRITPEDLDRKADIEDEGIALVVLFSLIMIGFCSFAIITLLHQKQQMDLFALALAAMGAPLGWFMLHMMIAFHYANLFYSEPGKKSGSGLLFPDTKEPGAADFLYYSFVIGMTAQVSDVQVTSTRIRRTTLAHSIVSFFFNTVLIAIAVNAVVAIAS